MDASPRPTPTFAGCRLEAELGRGGMGVVYRATQLRLGRPVALKVMAPELALDERFRQRFERESRLAASIDHPHVVPIYEADEERGRLYLIMRYVPGPDLGQLIRRDGRLHPARAAELTAQVGSALDAAHSSGLVHRDIKPANVLLAAGGGTEHAYLSDFGLTKRTSSETGITRTGVFLGTVDYVAPEQLRGDRVDARADVYSLAGLLFHALTGEVPYPRDDDMAKMFAHGQADPPRPSALVPGLGPGFDRVIARGMAKDPADRYPSAGDLGRAALAAAQGEQRTEPERTVATGAAAPLAPRPPRNPPAPEPKTRRQRPHEHVARTRSIHRRNLRLPLAMAAAALVALGLAGGVLATTLGGGQDPRSKSTGADRGTGSENGARRAAAPGEGARETTPMTRTPAQPAAPQREPLSSTSPVTTEGVGPVLVGMSRARAEEEAGTAFISEGEALQGCKYVSPANLDGVSFMVIGDEIARIDVRGPGIATQSGIRVGDTEEAVYEAYGDRLQREEHPYLPEGSFLKFTPEDSSDPNRMIFVTNGDEVEEIYAGREPTVDAPEGCV